MVESRCLFVDGSDGDGTLELLQFSIVSSSISLLLLLLAVTRGLAVDVDDRVDDRTFLFLIFLCDDLVAVPRDLAMGVDGETDNGEFLSELLMLLLVLLISVSKSNSF